MSEDSYVKRFSRYLEQESCLDGAFAAPGEKLAYAGLRWAYRTPAEVFQARLAQLQAAE